MVCSIGASQSFPKMMDNGSLKTPPELPEAERRADAYLRTCKALEQAICNTADVLVGAGVTLQMNGHQNDGYIDALNDALTSEAPPVARACRNIVHVCSSLGDELVALAGSLTGDFLAPLRELLTKIQAERERENKKLQKLEQDEVDATAALLETAKKKARASADLQEVAQDRAANGTHRTSIGATGRAAMKWFKRPSMFSSAESGECRLRKAALAQTTAVEELAARSDAALAARLRKERCIDDVRVFLGKIPAKRREVMEKSLHRCAATWGRASASLARAKDTLTQSAIEFVEWGGMSDTSVASTSASSGASEEQGALVAQAPKLVPRLRLDKVGGGPGGRIAPTSATSKLDSCSSRSSSSSEASLASVRSPTSSKHIPGGDSGDAASVSCGGFDPPVAPLTGHPTAPIASVPEGTPPSLLQATKHPILLSTCKRGHGSTLSNPTRSTTLPGGPMLGKAGLVSMKTSNTPATRQKASDSKVVIAPPTIADTKTKPKYITMI
eukprot:TRINITY_DN68075_c0_g1_i1.p1 TRINITY_DN68075_c0_g1~~TRINITY_DN68075_c0_g1_i1.p1  ORF type:complete len:502 (-),score=81.55 TRINITY_DN68075_c0_g1_i1:92-1597(-)